AISGFPSWDLGDRNPQLIEASIMLLHDEALGYRPYRYDHTEERATGDVDIHIDASVADRCARGSFGGLSRATHEKNLRRCTTWRQSRSRASWSRSTRDWRHRSEALRGRLLACARPLDGTATLRTLSPKDASPDLEWQLLRSWIASEAARSWPVRVVPSLSTDGVHGARRSPETRRCCSAAGAACHPCAGRR